jgi:hypothetical protein
VEKRQEKKEAELMVAGQGGEGEEVRLIGQRDWVDGSGASHCEVVC